jgi:hypothetical protein
VRTRFLILKPEPLESCGGTAPDGSIVTLVQALDIVGLLAVADVSRIECRAVPMIVMESRHAGPGGELIIALAGLDYVVEAGSEGRLW